MILTANQMKGLKIAVERYKTNQKYTIISGYAGSGKSTLVRFIIEALNVDEDSVCYCAFTGKAAEVLRQKGNKNVCTLHKLLYEHFPKPTGGFFRKIKLKLEYDVIVVDEISMAPKSLMQLLFKHNVYIIGLGDPGQLPPVDKNEDNHLLDSPHIFLDEIMRQAQESEIIRLTMKIRNNEPINYCNSKDVKIIPYKDLNTGALLWADQILTATNKKREQINLQMRELNGYGGDPKDGDKIICLRNYWEDISSDGNALVNGTIGVLQNNFKTWRELPKTLRNKIKKFDILVGDLVVPNTDDIYKNVEMDYKLITKNEKCCDWKLSYRLGQMRNKIGDIVPKEFTYAYAITIWKAQGSEWDDVLVLEENFPFDKDTHRRAMYTAATRASKRLVWVR